MSLVRFVENIREQGIFKNRADAIAKIETYKGCGAYWDIKNDFGDIVAMGGGILTHPGVVWVWVLATAEIDDYPIKAFKATKRAIRELQMVWKPNRIEAECVADNETYNRFLQKLGFTQESVLRKFGGNGEDYNKYTIIKE